MANPFLVAFLDGFTGGSLFSPAEMPGAATQFFADDSTEQPYSELTNSLLQLQLDEDISDTHVWASELFENLGSTVSPDVSERYYQGKFTKDELLDLLRNYEIDNMESVYQHYLETMVRVIRSTRIEKGSNLRDVLREKLRENQPIGF